MQKTVVNWGLTCEENVGKKSQKPYNLFLHYFDENIMKKQKINMWYYDNITGNFQFVNAHDYTFFANINVKHIDMSLDAIEQILTLKSARRLTNPAQIRNPRQPASMEIN